MRSMPFRWRRGTRGGDASHLYKDAELMGHIYSAPYALLEPGLVLVAVDGDGDGDGDEGRGVCLPGP